MAFAAAIIGIGAIGGAAISAKAAGKATKAQVQAGEKASDVQLQIFREQQATQQPFLQSGLAATNKLNALFGLPQVGQQQPQQPTRRPGLPGIEAGFGRGRVTPGRQGLQGLQRFPGGPGITTEQDVAGAQQQALQDFQTSPGFQFRLGEGKRAVESSAAARGGLLSGKGLRGVTEVSQNIASQEFGNYVGALQSLAGLGPTAAAQQNVAAGTFAANQATTLRDVGAARASGFVSQANAITGGIQGLTDLAAFGLGARGGVPADPSGAARSAAAGQRILFGG